MSSDHDAYWAAVSQGELTPEAHQHERECRTCADMRWALEELRWEYETVVPPAPVDLVEEMRREVTPPVPTAVASFAKPPPVPLYMKSPVRKRRRLTGVWVAIAAAISVLAAGVIAIAAGVRSSAVPAHADILLSDKCTPDLEQGKANQVVVAGVWGGEERQRFRMVLDQFESETKIKVIFASRDPEADRNMDDTIRSLGDGGCAPGVTLLPQPGLLRELSREGRLARIEPVVGDAVDANYLPIWRQLGTGEDDQLYGVWFKAANKSMLWYNAETFARAGVAPPLDWEGFKGVAQTLADKSIPPFSLAASKDAGWTLTDWFENIYLQTAGPELYDRLTRHEILWNDPTVVRALELMAEILKPEWVAPDPADTTYEESVRQVFDERDSSAAMVFEADFVANEITRTGARIGTDAKFFPFPSITGGKPTVVGAAEQVASGEVGGDVAVLTHDTEEARALLGFLAKPDAGVAWAREGGFLSPNRNFPQSAYPDDATRAAAEALSDSTAVRFDLSDMQPAGFGSKPGEGMWGILREFVKDRPPPAVTAARLEEAYCRTASPTKSAPCAPSNP